MGGNASKSRKVTIENENPASVIKVSEDVVQRMKGKEAVKNPVVVSQESALPYLHEPSLTSIQLRQAHVQELKENDKYWDKRIESVQQRYQKLQLIMDEEYAKALSEVKQKKNPEGVYKPYCLDSRKEIIDCYLKNKDSPMNCAKEVQQFADCVDKKTSVLISNRG